MLCVFEKILTGLTIEAQDVKASATIANAVNNKIQVTDINDAAKFRAGDIISVEGTRKSIRINQVQGTDIFLDVNLPDSSSYTGKTVCISDFNFEKTIDELHRIFDPWHTDFLPWLASWVALTLQDDWSEYQKRKLISKIASIYQERGLKKGLYTYLDIYAVTEEKPRIAIDDGDAVLRATFLDNGTAILHTVAHSSEVLGQAVLLHPCAIAADNNNNYIIADCDIYSPIPQKPTLWKMSSTGDIDYISSPQTPPRPQPIHSGIPLEKPTAVVVDKQNRYSVVDIGKITDDTSLNSAVYRFDPRIRTVIDKSTMPSFPAIHPVDMILDGSNNFVVLDRGTHPTGDPPSGPSDPKVVIVTEEPSLTVDEHLLAKVVEPTALVMDSTGHFIIADAKKQSTSDPANLVMVDPNAGWSETLLLDENNPLVFPTGLAFENPQTLLVCDTGIRWGSDGIGNRAMAEPAAIYRIDLSEGQPAITGVTYVRELVNPTKIMIDLKGKLIITDKGESNRDPLREWRAKANEFGIAVHFSQLRPTTEIQQSIIRRGIEDVVNEQKPGHTSFWMKYK
jgi:phage tail-like protein